MDVSMVALRGVLPLVLTGTTGLAVLGFGLSGLSGLDPRLEQAARTVQQDGLRPDVARPAAPDVPDGTAPGTAPMDASPVAPVFRGVDCPEHHDRTRHADEA
jgi:hypothetical protein